MFTPGPHVYVKCATVDSLISVVLQCVGLQYISTPGYGNVPLCWKVVQIFAYIAIVDIVGSLFFAVVAYYARCKPGLARYAPLFALSSGTCLLIEFCVWAARCKDDNSDNFSVELGYGFGVTIAGSVFCYLAVILYFIGQKRYRDMGASTKDVQDKDVEKPKDININGTN